MVKGWYRRLRLLAFKQHGLFFLVLLIARVRLARCVRSLGVHIRVVAACEDDSSVSFTSVWVYRAYAKKSFFLHFLQPVILDYYARAKA